jgi:hypothetical protein
MTIIHHHEAFQPYLLKSYTLLHLLGWLEALDIILGTDDCPFDDADELATQLEHWRAEFQANSGNHAVKAEEIKVITYGTDTILLCKELTGEFIKLTVIP